MKAIRRPPHRSWRDRSHNHAPGYPCPSHPLADAARSEVEPLASGSTFINRTYWAISHSVEWLPDLECTATVCRIRWRATNSVISMRESARCDRSPSRTSATTARITADGTPGNSSASRWTHRRPGVIRISCAAAASKLRTGADAIVLVGEPITYPIPLPGNARSDSNRATGVWSGSRERSPERGTTPGCAYANRLRPIMTIGQPFPASLLHLAAHKPLFGIVRQSHSYR